MKIPGFNSQHPLGGSSVTLVPGNPTPSSDLSGHHMDTYTILMQTRHSCTQNKTNLSKERNLGETLLVSLLAGSCLTNS